MASDLEMTRLCAQAMGFVEISNIPGGVLVCALLGAPERYDPLHDDAQAMALLKRFRPMIDTRDVSPPWNVWDVIGCGQSVGSDLNRCIVECVAQSQAAKATATPQPS